MINNFLKGIQIGLGFIFIIGLLFGIVFAVGFHSADEILGGIFLGDYKFTGEVVYNGTLNATDATLIGNFGSSGNTIEKSNTSICNSTSEGNLRYNPTTLSIEGCGDQGWENIKTISYGSCDYIINSNCWNIVWRAATDNYNTRSYTYSDTDSVSKATAFAFGFINSADVLSNTYYTNNAAVITDLKAQPPFHYDYVDRSLTMYDINTDSSSSGTFKYGNDGFNNVCSDGWNIGGTFTRICFTGISIFPFYSGWGHSSIDYCTNSNQAHNAVACTSEKRFVILAKMN